MCERLEEVLAEHNPVVQPPEEVQRLGVAGLRTWVLARRDKERQFHVRSHVCLCFLCTAPFLWHGVGVRGRACYQRRVCVERAYECV
jgi:hypothetical protein